MKINRLNDLFFKYLLGSDERKDLTLNFLNAILADGDRRFESIEFTNKDLEPEADAGKLSKLDIRGVLDNGELIDIEVQVCSYAYMAERSLYYWARMYAGQLNEGEDYKRLKPAIALNLLDFNHLKKEAFWHNTYTLQNTNADHKALSKHLEMHFLELSKLKISDVKQLKRGELWGAYFSGKCTEKEMEEIAMQEPAIQQAIHAENYFAGSADYRMRYEQREKAIKDYRSFLSAAIDEGREAGMEEGHKAGLAEGLLKGIKKGRAEGRAEGMLEMALMLLKDGMPLEKVKSYTKLSEKQLEEIHRKL